MKIGVSTASLYPMHTEDALLKVAESGIRHTELFINCSEEMKGGIFETIKNTVKEYGIRIISAHPFSSPMETLFMFSSYDRRVNEIFDTYKRYFSAVKELGGTIFVVHGAIHSAKCTDELYIERFYELIKIGKSEGITVAQENVHYCKSGRNSFIEKLSREMGDEIKFVLDIKQAVRSGYTVSEVLSAMGGKVVHLHLSDHNSEYDCLPVGKGNFDFTGFFKELKNFNYKGDAVVELYRDNYGDYLELADCVRSLKELL